MKWRQIQTGVKFVALLLGLVGTVTGCGSEGGSEVGSANAPVGRGGSMARFAIVNDVLYTISGPKLQLYRIDTPGDPKVWAATQVGFDIETLFGFGQYLLIGSQTGIHIYDSSNPEFPQFVSKLVHATSCDPVVAYGDYAYVTLRGDSMCNTGSNQLDIINISDPPSPLLLKSYPMQGPKGLGVDGNKLFVCDGMAGLKVFDVSDPLQLSLLQQISEVNCYDVIPDRGNLIVAGPGSIEQYDYRQIPLSKSSEFSF